MAKPEVRQNVPWYVTLGEDLLSSPEPNPENLALLINECAYSPIVEDKAAKRYLDRLVRELNPTPETQNIIDLYLLFYEKQKENSIRFDPKLMDLTEDNVYIGGIPLLDNHRFTLLPGFTGTVIGRFGGSYDIKCTPDRVEIKLQGRKGQQTNEPGYFYVKKEDSYAESIVVTKVPGGSQRDSNLFYGKLLHYLLDNYPFSNGPVDLYKGEWRSGDNEMARSKEEARLTKKVQSGGTFSTLVNETKGTPLEHQSEEQIYICLQKPASEALSYKKQYVEPEMTITVSLLEEKIIEDFITTIAVWKTPTGQVLNRRLGFDQVRVQRHTPFFVRDTNTLLLREKDRLSRHFIPS